MYNLTNVLVYQLTGFEREATSQLFVKELTAGTLAGFSRRRRSRHCTGADSNSGADSGATVPKPKKALKDASDAGAGAGADAGSGAKATKPKQDRSQSGK